MSVELDSPPAISDEARAHAADLVACLAQVADLAYRVGIDLDIHLDFAGTIASGIAGGLDIVRDMSVARIRAHVGGITRDLDIVRPFVRDLARDFDHNPDRGDARVFARVHVRILARELDRVLDRAQTTAAALIISLDREGVGRAGGMVQTVSRDAAVGQVRRRQSRGAQRLTGLTVRCLPSQYRARYREEYGSELYELACVSHRAQWQYAINLMIRTWPLRRELRRAACDSAPRRRWAE